MPNNHGMGSIAEPESRERGWAFGPFELRSGGGLVREDGSEVALAAKPLAMLLHLVRHHERVVPRAELLEAIWPGVSISAAAFDSALRDLRRALGESAAEARFIETLRSRGLRFVTPVRELEAENAWEEASEHLARAIEALDRVGNSQGRGTETVPRERGSLLVALARSRWAGGATTEARRAFLDAAQVGRRARDGEVLARAALGFAGRTDVTPGVNREAVALLEEALALLPAGDSTLRAELMARLGTELYYDDDGSAPERWAREAVAMAERAGDPAALAYTLTALHFVRQRPDVAPQERTALGDRMLEQLDGEPPSDVLALALQTRIVDQLEQADGEGFRETLARLRQVAEALEQPFFRWIASLLDGTRLLLDGDVEAAEAAAEATLSLGEQIGSPNALPAFAGQIFGVRREQDRLAELAPLMEETSGQVESLPIFRAGRVAVLAEAPDARRAREALNDLLATGLSDFPRDQNWVATLGTIAPAVASHGSDDQRRALYELLTPFAERLIVVGQGATTHGAASHHLGLLAAALGEHEEAAAHFHHATRLHHRLRAPLWIERSRAAT